ncbi:exopolysaccharide synthesis, ExoD family protein [Asticcacaulis biprosthecium C19]|uniref:Exopolysaccharide synthesis, ExoD family protein n=1 Tax=Asticcacaulis biprosthecium C19 TaxID=715226 RepID=F4QMK8_9CAUL|nr:exopolysaccharide biosynthesis protein [Asticcacaulis biprosthecium]EGF91449.1 exopolysaccharide synthesis, ExoD family protein [Asticcacaulis biprosthecium C19]
MGFTEHMMRSDDVPASKIISDLAARLDGDRVSVGDLLAHLEGRALGLVLLILSLPICIPNIPGISTIFGLLLIGPAIQMILGAKSLWMPRFVKRWSFKGQHLRGALKACGAVLRKIEFLAKPRLHALTRRPAMVYAGIQTLVLALILILPMPGANIIPGVAIVLTGLGVLQRDGLFMLLSVPVAAGAVAWVYFGGKLALALFMASVEKLHRWWGVL